MTHLDAEPVVLAPDLAVELGDGDEGLQTLASGDEPSLVDIKHLCREGLFVLHTYSKKRDQH